MAGIFFILGINCNCSVAYGAKSETISWKRLKTEPSFLDGAGLAIVGLLGILDYATGNELTLSLFYLVPIVTGHMGCRPEDGSVHVIDQRADTARC